MLGNTRLSPGRIDTLPMYWWDESPSRKPHVRKVAPVSPAEKPRGKVTAMRNRIDVLVIFSCGHNQSWSTQSSHSSKLSQLTEDKK